MENEIKSVEVFFRNGESRYFESVDFVKESPEELLFSFNNLFEGKGTTRFKLSSIAGYTMIS